MLSLLGRRTPAPVRQLETFPTPAGCVRVQFVTTELTSLCPVTGQPDFSTLTLTYAPRGGCLESKSLKLYLWAFRDEGHFCEALAARIAADVGAACAPAWVHARVEQQRRGGIATCADAHWRPASV